MINTLVRYASIALLYAKHLFKRQMNYALGITVIAFLFQAQALPPINLFRPSDRPLLPEIWPGSRFQFTIGYEGALSVRGFKDDHEECRQVSTGCSSEQEKKVSILQIYQSTQNVLAGLKGFDARTPLGQLSQLFNINDENGDQGIFAPKACLKIPLNLLLSAQLNFDHCLSLGFYLPVISAELTNVRWRECTNDSTVEDRLESDLIKVVRKCADLNIKGWKRTGIGDFVALMLWRRDFPQVKPLLKNVRVNTRFGINFPTGKKQDEDAILAFPFGNDGSWGLQFAGGLDLSFGSYIRGGLDAEFLYLFGNTKCRRLKTDCNQTDLLFLTKIPAFREFGLGQQFNLYLETFDFCKGAFFKVNYQYLKRNEDKLFICSDRIDPFIVNGAESLQDWTAHSLIISTGYDFGYRCPNSWATPAFSAWFKWGFNGKRALLANTLGAMITVSF